MNKSCSTCAHYEVPLDTKTGKRKRVTKDSAYRCNASLPELVLPNSVLLAYNFKPYKAGTLIAASLGKDCALYTEYEGLGKHAGGSWFREVKVGDMLTPIPDWNRSEHPRNRLAPQVKVLEIAEGCSQTGVLFTVTTNSGQLRQLDAAWFERK